MTATPQARADPAFTTLKPMPGGVDTAVGVVPMPPVVPLPSWPMQLSPEHTVVPLVPMPQLNAPPALSDADASTP